MSGNVARALSRQKVLETPALKPRPALCPRTFIMEHLRLLIAMLSNDFYLCTFPFWHEILFHAKEPQKIMLYLKKLISQF